MSSRPVPISFIIVRKPFLVKISTFTPPCRTVSAPLANVVARGFLFASLNDNRTRSLDRETGKPPSRFNILVNVSGCSLGKNANAFPSKNTSATLASLKASLTTLNWNVNSFSEISSLTILLFNRAVSLSLLRLSFLAALT